MEKMRAVRIEEPEKIKVVEMDRPVPRKGEALLKIKYCGLCGSDILTYTGNQPFTTYPRIPGHEFSAEIVAIEANILGFQPGMLVTANPYFNCGQCYSCKNGKVNCCEQNQTMGVQRDGSFAEYICMPVERICDGKDLPAQTLALIEPFSISYHAIGRGNIQPADKVLVIGAGPIGIFAMIAAKFRGATVFVADVLEKRLEMARKMGADGVINSGTEDLSTRVKELTDSHGMDVCVEAVGFPQTFLGCLDHVCFGGKVVLIGNGKKETTFNHSLILKKELNIYGSRNSLNAFIPLIQMVAEAKVDISRMVTNVYSLDQVTNAFEDLKNNDGSMTKVLVEF
jgi:2-desacetyl-2-hydroxyethyl bacteriochlorophyllide A dehydrogenase